jgi:phospholipid/cholesterol/gamma-HCH transport system substrate-binding protein
MRTHRLVKWAQFRVAAVTVVALLILGVLLYLLTGGMIFREQTKLYLYIPDATGLAQGSPVRVNGIDVGKVSDVALSGSTEPQRVVRVTMAVARDFLALIPTGSYAELGNDDPVGDKFVDITSRGTGSLTPNSEIPYKAPSDFMKTLDISQFEANLRQMDAILTDIETGRSRVGQFVLGNQLYNDLRGRIADIHSALHKVAGTESPLAQELYTDRLYRQMMTPVVQLDQALARLQSGQGPGQLLRDTAQYDQAVATIANLRQSIQDFRASPIIQSDALYSDLTRTVVSLTRTVDQINAGPLFGAPQDYESWTGLARELARTMRDFREDPRKYLRLKVF